MEKCFLLLLINESVQISCILLTFSSLRLVDQYKQQQKAKDILPLRTSLKEINSYLNSLSDVLEVMTSYFPSSGIISLSFISKKAFKA